jgi:hypothetical protein
VLIDSGSPFTVLPDDAYSLGRECTEFRAAGGLELTAPTEEALEAAITRFRFDEVPIIRAPMGGAGGWDWTAGDDLHQIHVGGVMGGNLMREFAVELRHRREFEPTVSFFVHYPGSEAILADQGRAHISLQFPGQLAGRVLYDRCEIGPGIDCELEGIDLDPSDEVLIYESTRMVVDACVAPPPCGVHWALAESDEPVTPGEEEYECKLAPGGPLINESCEAEELGAGSSLMVATGIPGMVLFDDSAARILGDLESLPACSDLPADAADAMAVPACLEAEGAALSIPGWPPLTNLRRFKLRSLSLVEGLTHVTGDPPCMRARARLDGLQGQCTGFAEHGRPWRPNSDENTSLASHAAYFGEVHWLDEQVLPDLDRWIDLLIVPATSPTAQALRREIGSKSIELDGLLGSALLKNTETVLDYTETDEHPGIRITCLDPGEGDCVSLPACGVESDAPGSGSFGRVSCCFGLPPKLVTREVLEGIDKEAPRIEDTCCPALPFAVRDELFVEGLCTGQYLP